MNGPRSRVIGLGSYLPPRVVTNDDLAQMMDTSDEWIVQRTGIRERRWVEGVTSTSDLALEASQKALGSAGLAPEDLDMVFVATISPDHFFPGSAVFLQTKLGLAGIPAIDVRQQCTGFIYALSMADQYIRTGSARRILVVGAEVHSKGLDKSTNGRDITVLFGDGAGAVILEATGVEDARSESHLLSTHLYSDGAHAEELWVPAVSTAYDEEIVDRRMLERGDQYPKMNGRQVFVNAVKRMPEAIETALDHNGYQGRRHRPVRVPPGQPPHQRGGCATPRRARREGLQHDREIRQHDRRHHPDRSRRSRQGRKAGIGDAGSHGCIRQRLHLGFGPPALVEP